MSKQPSARDDVPGRLDVRPEASVAESPEPTRFARLVTQNAGPIWRALRRLGVPEADVDDAAQQVFLVASGKLSNVRLESERPYLFAVAARVASHMRRSNRRRETATQRLGELERAEVATPEQLAQGREQFTRVLSRMPSDVRIVFVLFELNGMSLDQIAQHLELPRGTVASRLQRARTGARLHLTSEMASTVHPTSEMASSTEESAPFPSRRTLP